VTTITTVYLNKDFKEMAVFSWLVKFSSVMTLSLLCSNVMAWHRVGTASIIPEDSYNQSDFPGTYSSNGGDGSSGNSGNGYNVDSVGALAISSSPIYMYSQSQSSNFYIRSYIKHVFERDGIIDAGSDGPLIAVRYSIKEHISLRYVDLNSGTSHANIWLQGYGDLLGNELSASWSGPSSPPQQTSWESPEYDPYNADPYYSINKNWVHDFDNENITTIECAIWSKSTGVRRVSWFSNVDTFYRVHTTARCSVIMP
jgi:hypothetical protein